MTNEERFAKQDEYFRGKAGEFDEVRRWTGKQGRWGYVFRGNGEARYYRVKLGDIWVQVSKEEITELTGGCHDD